MAKDKSKARDGMSANKETGQQIQNSQQSMSNPGGGSASASKGEANEKPGSGRPKPARAGIGSSQGQDRGTSERDQDRDERSPGTPHLERGNDSGSTESLVNDPTGAYKERP